jgi:pSer/pThr/pTyr-binding forkhead associated (FHA) protein
VVLPDGRTVTVDEGPLTIGRLPECSIVVEDANVSRRHAELRRDGDDVVVSDLGSTNGTRVNGAQVRGARRLNDGDEITVGRTSLRFEVR